MTIKVPSNALLVFDRSEKDQAAADHLPPAQIALSSTQPTETIQNNTADGKTGGTEEKMLLHASLRFRKIGLLCLALSSFCIFIAYFVISFNVKGRLYEYSCPLSAMWMALANFWYTTVFLSWWQLVKTKSQMMLQVWAVISSIFALEGFLCLVCYAAAKREEAASGLSFLWIPSGVLGTTMCLAQKKAAAYIISELSTSDSSEKSTAVDPPTPKGKCYSRCCCTCQFWLNFTALFLAAWLFVFSTGCVCQAAFTASDDNSMTPPGKIYTITTNDVELQLHLYCFGNSSSKTVVFEHGGGANSMTLLALAEELVNQYGARSCIYDRLGYGFSPSYYVSPSSLPNTGVILSKLLAEAGEKGPFACAGHSAGAEACLWFAHENQAVDAVAMMDGYPDLIRAGSFRPGQGPNPGILAAIRGMAVAVGATGLARGAVGDPGEDFVPSSERGTVIGLYGQTRFWLSQYWDVAADLEADEEKRLYKQLGGRIGEGGLVEYGGSLRGVKVLVLPAERTVNKTFESTCGGEESKNEYCCGHARNSRRCVDLFADSVKYRDQALLYAATLSSDVNGTVVFAPKGAEHTFVNDCKFYQWIAQQIASEFL